MRIFKQDFFQNKQIFLAKVLVLTLSFYFVSSLFRTPDRVLIFLFICKVLFDFIKLNTNMSLFELNEEAKL